MMEDLLIIKVKTVDFKNTIIIMTSNIGSSYLLEAGENINDEAKELVMNEMKMRFKVRVFK